MTRMTLIVLAAATLGACSQPENNKSSGNNATTNNAAMNNAATNNGATNNASTNSTTNNTSTNSTTTTNNSTVSAGEAALYAAYCAYDATCDTPDYSTVGECTTDLGSYPLTEEACEIVNDAAVAACTQALSTMCVGDYDNYPEICYDIVDDSGCCEEFGGVLVNGECLDPCTMADECGDYGFTCEMNACMCPAGSVEGFAGDLYVCAVECPDGTCAAGFMCVDELCVPE